MTWLLEQRRVLEKIVRKFFSISSSLLCCCIVLHLALERTTAVVVLLSTFTNFSYPEGIGPPLALLPWGWVRPLIRPFVSAVTTCNALLWGPGCALGLFRLRFGASLQIPTTPNVDDLSVTLCTITPQYSSTARASSSLTTSKGCRGTCSWNSRWHYVANASKSAPLQAPAKRSATQHDFDE